MTYTYFYNRIKNAVSLKELSDIKMEMKYRNYNNRAAEILYNAIYDKVMFVDLPF